MSRHRKPGWNATATEALRVGGRRSKRETVNEALAEYVQRRRRRGFAKLFGTVDFRPDWNYKQARRRG